MDQVTHDLLFVFVYVDNKCHDDYGLNLKVAKYQFGKKDDTVPWALNKSIKTIEY